MSPTIFRPSSFALVQGRLRPKPSIFAPPVQQQPQQIQPQYAAPTAALMPPPTNTSLVNLPNYIPGRIDGGTIWEASTFNIPGYQDGEGNIFAPDDGSPPPTTDEVYGTPEPSVLNYYMDRIHAENPELSPLEVESQARNIMAFEQAQLTQQQGLSGADHFYEAQAEAARQFDIRQAQAEQEAEDARKIASFTAATTQAKALQDWRDAQIAAAQSRRATELGAGSQVQNVFLQGLRQAAPGQNLPFAPNLLYESLTQGNAGFYPQDQTQQPNIPSLNF